MAAFEENDDFPWEQYMQEEIAIYEAQQQLNHLPNNNNHMNNNNHLDDDENIRAPDAILNERLIDDDDNDVEFAGIGAGAYVVNQPIITPEERLKQQLEAVRVREEEERQKRIDEIRKQTEEYWTNIAEKLKPIIDLSMRLRIDDKMRLMCVCTENIINKYLDKKTKFLYMNENDYELFYEFIHVIYPIDISFKKRISDELYEYVQTHFRLE